MAFYHIKYRLFAILWVLLPTIPTVSVANTTTLNVGCFNIRFKTTADQGELSWDNRKSYVARTIIDFKYDIVGVNEMNAGSQQEDMKSLLPEYSFVEWGGNSSTVPNQGTVNAVLFRTDKFDLLEEGHYFLCTDPSKSLISWDNSSGNKRFAVWVKLRVKETSELFYYFITHLDHLGSDARNEGTRINIEKVRSISGHYPAIICGDHNSSAIRYPFYDLCSAYLSDSRKVSEAPFPWPKDGTLCKWDPEKKDGTRLDYVWVKGMKVHTYNHINETFGRGVTPSDHFPVIVSISLMPFVASHTRYVDVNAADGGDGSKSAPFRNIQEAVDATCNGDTIYVAQGHYSVTESELLKGRSATLNIPHSLDIFGGYDSAFKEVTGRTVLSGDINGNDEIADGVLTGNEENAYRVVTVQKYCALTLCNFEIVGGNANGSVTTGAGIAGLGSPLILNNVIIRDNQSTGQGAGIYAAGQLLCTGCRFIRNISSANGGAYFTAYTGVELWWRYAMTGCYFSENEAVQGSAGYHSGYSWAYLGYNTYACNRATYGGTVSLNGTAYASKTTLVNNTFVNNRIEATGGVINEIKGGSAVYANLNAASTLSIVNNTIVGNHASCYKNGTPTADFYGAAVHIYNGTPFIFNNVIAGNRSTSIYTGDVYNAGQPATTGYNIFSSTDNIGITPAETDILGTSADASILLLGNMLESNIVEGDIVPVLALNGGSIETVKVKRRFFGSNAINVLPASQFEEKLLKGDVDNTIELRDKLIFDQRGVERSTDGTSSIGAYEYGKGGTGITETAATSPVSTYQNGSTLYLSAAMVLQDVRIFSMTGSTVIHLGEVNAGETPVNISRLYSGVYILSWKGGTTRFVKG
ncbi:endonuclease/exonuclease/phosphatase family protein [Bacteroides salyersiae]|uniref:endonuclease/exonuclease/phosphatase family protein n=1 Tax=Bacteroides salyersiae TaxID=291644 RepID=UPI001C38C245|nr:endonuclease/exonuclease/phosphatase family protein [Bacteroides salyersiae]MBV4205214.1 endonuclease/exonuclease/phosphatase family protein [Bacteroides salyersiae]MCB6650661.1 endonuclease/exonuclease/phosphatase family protein [Bacteroides salyersiae]